MAEAFKVRTDNSEYPEAVRLRELVILLSHMKVGKTISVETVPLPPYIAQKKED